MIIKKLLNDLKNDFPEYEYKLQIQGGGWARVFISHNNIQLGRINFSPNKDGSHDIYGMKHYKPNRDGYEYENCDDIFHLFYFWLRTQKRIDISYLVPIAKHIRKEKIQNIKNWRKANPKFDQCGIPKKRPKISTDWMPTFKKLVHNKLNKYIIEHNL